MKKPEFLEKVKQIHFVGIKGVGMTALACCAQDLGIKISGSDFEETFVTDKILKEREIHWQKGFSKEHLKSKPDLVITTGAHGGLRNPEVVEAAKRKIPILTHGQALGKIMEGKDGISVCGVGGKTTTASLIATILEIAGRKPSFAIGVGEIFPLGAPGRYSSGKEFVAEADEYVNSPGIDERPRFIFQNPRLVVVTNIEYDHPDIYQNLAQTKAAFTKFFEKIPANGLLISCLDNLNNQEVAQKFFDRLQTYGFSSRADWRIEKVSFKQGQTIFNLFHRGVTINEITLKIPGRFNVLNATAAFAVGKFLGLDARIIKKGLAVFTGTKRRFEFIGEVKGIKVYDDYAHHPREIQETLLAAKKWYPENRLIVIFQPHTYSRTKALLADFARSFSLADKIGITEIYASARETEDLRISGQLLAEETRKYNLKTIWLPGEKEVSQFLAAQAQKGDLIITLGAGDIFQWHKSILKALKG